MGRYGTAHSMSSTETPWAAAVAAIASKPDAIFVAIVDDKAYDNVIKEAVDAGILVLAVNVDDSEGAKGNARKAFIGQGFVAAGYSLAKAQAENFPKDGPLNLLVGVNAPGQTWSEQRAGGVTKYLEEYKAANPGREINITRIDSATDLALTADRIGAYLNANPNTTAYFDTGYWHAGVAKVLKGVVDAEKPGLVILGKQAIDSDNNQTGQMLGALTGFAQGTFASKVEVAGDKVNVTREIDGGLQTVALALPAIVTTDLRLNEPRYASLPNIMKAKKKPLDVVTPDALGVSTTSTVKTLKVEAPAARSAGIKVKSVAELVEKLKNEAKVI